LVGLWRLALFWHGLFSYQGLSVDVGDWPPQFYIMILPRPQKRVKGGRALFGSPRRMESLLGMILISAAPDFQQGPSGAREERRKAFPALEYSSLFILNQWRNHHFMVEFHRF
jgi:hypothetical protein